MLKAIAIAAFTLMMAQPVIAAAIEIDDPRWPKLSSKERQALIDELRAGGAIDPGDKIVYVGKPAKGPTEKNTDGLSFARGLRSIVCGSKNLANLAACSAKSGGGVSTCQQAEDARMAKASSICGKN